MLANVPEARQAVDEIRQTIGWLSDRFREEQAAHAADRAGIQPPAAHGRPRRPSPRHSGPGGKGTAPGPGSPRSPRLVLLIASTALLVLPRGMSPCLIMPRTGRIALNLPARNPRHGLKSCRTLQASLAAASPRCNPVTPTTRTGPGRCHGRKWGAEWATRGPKLWPGDEAPADKDALARSSRDGDGGPDRGQRRACRRRAGLAGLTAEGSSQLRAQRSRWPGNSARITRPASVEGGSSCGSQLWPASPDRRAARPAPNSSAERPIRREPSP